MNETEWLTCKEPTALLAELPMYGLARKKRLFLCACCRRLLANLPEGPCGNAIVVGEAFADGQASNDERYLALEAAKAAVRTMRGNMNTLPAGAVFGCVFARIEDDDVVENEARRVVEAASVAAKQNRHRAKQAERRYQADLLRDIMGNPFRRIPRQRFGQVFRNDTVAQLAEQIYDDRAFDLLPILGDALEDAGCTDASLLSHCRSGGEHVRGCWLLDLVLDKS